MGKTLGVGGRSCRTASRHDTGRLGRNGNRHVSVQARNISEVRPGAHHGIETVMKLLVKANPSQALRAHRLYALMALEKVNIGPANWIIFDVIRSNHDLHMVALRFTHELKLFIRSQAEARDINSFNS